MSGAHILAAIADYRLGSKGQWRGQRDIDVAVDLNPAEEHPALERDCGQQGRLMLGISAFGRPDQSTSIFESRRLRLEFELPRIVANYAHFRFSESVIGIGLYLQR